MSITAYADTRYQTMQAVQATEGIRTLCYDQQVALLESLIRPGMTVLDVGCGPNLPYRAPHAYVIGLDPSAASLAANTDVDERIVGSATAIPLPDASVDLVIVLYALHHITGPSVADTRALRVAALWEVNHVLRPGGQRLIFEMAPNPLARLFQWALWPTAKRLLGDRLDSYFWGDDELAHPGVTVQRFRCSPFETFAPIFALPWLKIPRFLYPFDAVCYRWTKEIPHG